MNFTLFNDEWIMWIQNNIKNNCKKDDIFNILLNYNFNYDDICLIMNHYPQDNKIILRKNEQLEVILINKAFTNKNYLDNSKFITIRNNSLELYKIYDFLSDIECKNFIDIINDCKLIKSPITRELYNNKKFRTSLTCFFDRSDNIINNLNNNICYIMNLPKNKSEGLQGQKYLIGNEFKKHSDYFDKNLDTTYLQNGGQRTWTFMIYLNDVEDGGETKFTEINKTIKAKKGMALIWNNLNEDGTENTKSMHCGMPVKKGEKYIITQWFRENVI